MIKLQKERMAKFFRLLGRRNSMLLGVCAVVGFFWFATETAFVYVLQLFLAAVGLIDSSHLKFFTGPKSLSFACVILLGFAVMRFAVTAARGCLAILVQQEFVRH